MHPSSISAVRLSGSFYPSHSPARAGDPRVFELQRFHLQRFQMLLELPEIGPIVQVTKSFGSPMMLVRMCIDDEHIAPRAHYAAQFSQCSARTHHVMHEHMTHRDINGTARQGELLGHPFLEENMLVPGMGHLLPGPC